MAKYQACFINDENSVFATEDFDAADDAAAIAQARRLYRSGSGKGYEIWQGTRHFHSQSYRGDESLTEEQMLEKTLPFGQTVIVPVPPPETLLQQISKLARRALKSSNRGS